MIELPSSLSTLLHFVQQFPDVIVKSLDSAEIRDVLVSLSPRNLSAMKIERISSKFEKNNATRTQTKKHLRLAE